MKESVYDHLRRVLDPRYSIAGWANMSGPDLREEVEILDGWIAQEEEGQCLALYSEWAANGRAEAERRDVAEAEPAAGDVRTVSRIEHVRVVLPPPALTVELPLPPAKLGANAGQGGSWHGTAKAVRKYGGDCAHLLTLAKRKAEGSGATFPLPSVLMRPVFYWPDERHRDDDNAIYSLKTTRDALQPTRTGRPPSRRIIAGAGIVIDDRSVTILPPLFRLDRKNSRVALELYAVTISFESEKR